MEKCTVGKLRQQAALTAADNRIVLVVRDPKTDEIKATNFQVISCYPDTTDEHGEWGSTFKIEITPIQ